MAVQGMGGGQCWMRERATQIQLVCQFFQFVRVFEGMSENCCVHVFKSCQNFFLVQKNVCDLIEPL